MTRLQHLAPSATKIRKPGWLHSDLFYLRLTPYEGWVFARLVSKCSADHLYIPEFAQELIASDCGMSLRQVKRVIKSLEKKGLIKQEKHFIAGSKKLSSSGYYIADCERIRDMKLKVLNPHYQSDQQGLTGTIPENQQGLTGTISGDSLAQTIHSLFILYPQAQALFHAQWFLALANRYLTFDVEQFIPLANSILSLRWSGAVSPKLISNPTAHLMCSWHREMTHRCIPREEIANSVRNLCDWLAEGGLDRPKSIAGLFHGPKIWEYLQLSEIWTKDRIAKQAAEQDGAIPFTPSR